MAKTQQRISTPQRIIKAATRGDRRAGFPLDRSAEVALYYGFTAVPPPLVTRADRELARMVLEEEMPPLPGHLGIFPEEKVALLRTYQEKRWGEQLHPVMPYWIQEDAQHKNRGERGVYAELHILGVPKSISEAILIKTTLDILKTEGYRGLTLCINSLGDRESLHRFLREAALYYRKHLDTLHAPCRQALKRDIFEIFRCPFEACVTLREQAPIPMNFLSEPSRLHLKELLEYLEALEVPYRVHHHLLFGKSFCSHTLFEVREEEHSDPGELLAIGSRYNPLAKKIGFKHELPAAGVIIILKKERTHAAPHVIRRIRKPKICFIQLGFEAKLRSLKVLETLREANIAVHQALTVDKLSPQLSLAEHLRIPYTIIMGQKEALEGSVIVRNMRNHSQETMPIAILCQYLQKLNP